MAASMRKTRVTFDYDGLMNLDLEVRGKQTTVLDQLDIAVPIRDSEAPLMHVVGAGVRGNYAGNTPPGAGEIWNNTQATTYGMPNQFVPYLWVGGTRRGLAWYADSDENWSVAEGKPELSLARKDGALTLTLHLISKPVKLDRPRTFRFAFQATPVKPRPDDWRNWSFAGQLAEARAVTIFGSCRYWGSVSAYGDVYPRDHDYSLRAIRQVRKQNGDDQTEPSWKNERVIRP